MKIAKLLAEARAEKWTGGIYTLDANSAEALVDLVRAARMLDGYTTEDERSNAHCALRAALAALGDEWRGE